MMMMMMMMMMTTAFPFLLTVQDNKNKSKLLESKFGLYENNVSMIDSRADLSFINLGFFCSFASCILFG